MSMQQMMEFPPVLEQDMDAKVERVRVQYRLGVKTGAGTGSVSYFDTTPQRWEEDAEIYLRYGQSMNHDRIVWLENRIVIETEWYQ